MLHANIWGKNEDFPSDGNFSIFYSSFSVSSTLAILTVLILQLSEGYQSALLLSFTAGTVSHVRYTNMLIGMYVMIVAERNKPVAFEVLVLPGFPNTYTVQSTGLNQGLLFSLHSACFRIE